MVIKTNLPWLVWLNGVSAGPRSKGSPVRFPVRAHAWDVGQVPSRGLMRGNHTLMCLFLSSPSLPLSLKLNKIKSLKNPQICMWMHRKSPSGALPQLFPAQCLLRTSCIEPLNVKMAFWVQVKQDERCTPGFLGITLTSGEVGYHRVILGPVLVISGMPEKSQAIQRAPAGIRLTMLNIFYYFQSRDTFIFGNF